MAGRISPSKISRKIGSLSIFALALLSSAGIAHADWREEIGVFRIGVSSAYETPFSAKKLEPFRKAISDALDMPVEIFQARDAAALMDAVASSRIEYALMSALSYATLEIGCRCVEPVVAPVGKNGADAVRSSLVVNAEKVGSLEDLRGKTLAVGASYSLAGYILPKGQFRIGAQTLANGVVQTKQVSSTEEAVKMMLDGSVDGFFGWDYVALESGKTFAAPYERLLENDAPPVATFWQSEPVRHGPHVMHQSLSPEAKEILRAALPKLHETSPLAFDAVSPDLSGSLMPVKPLDYKSALGVLAAIRKTSVEN